MLYLLRHGLAAAQGPDGDRNRPLDVQGLPAIERLAAWIAGRSLVADFVLCSTAVRTRETLDRVLPAFTGTLHVQYEDDLYLADGRQLLKQLRRIPDSIENLLVVGHNPGIHDLAQTLADVSTGPLAGMLAAGFPTTALAGFQVPTAWTSLAPGTARLVSFVTPKSLG